MKPVARLACLTLCLLLAGGGAWATAQQKAEPATLKKLRAEISRLKSQEAGELKRKHAVQAQLSELEKKIADTSRQLQSLDAQAGKLRARREQLGAEIARARNAAEKARRELTAALQAAFMLGREPQLKLALNGDDPAVIARLLGYYGYYSRARGKHLLELTATLRHYQALQQQLAATAADLKQTAKEQQAALAQLEQARQSRQAVIDRLTRDIAHKHSRTEQLQHDAARLEKLINSVNQDLADVPSRLLDDVDFARQRGHLPWPVSGHILSRFGDARAEGNLTWEAIRIAAPAGTDVHAIAYGRVAYAGWLPYYGLVLIVDHGSGYLTVYAHNQSIYGQVGDWVKPGDVMATVGTSGGQDKPELYFQIRHHGKALDPAGWFASKAPSAAAAVKH